MEKMDFSVYVNTFLFKDDTISTDDYETYAEKEDGFTGVVYDTSETDFLEEWKDQHYTIPELLKELEGYVRKELDSLADNNTLDGRMRKANLRGMLADCQGWQEDDLTVEES